MPVIAPRGMQSLPLIVVAPPAVVVGVRAPVEGGGDDVVTTLRIGEVVAAALDDVDLAGRGPVAVGVFDGQHPDGRPEPVAFWHLGYDFDLAVLDGGAFFSVDAGGFDGVDNGAVGGVGGGDAVHPVGGGAEAGAGEVDHVVLRHQILILQRRLDHQYAVLDEDVLVGVRRLLELAVSIVESASYHITRSLGLDIPITANLNLLGPYIVTQPVRKVLHKYWTVHMLLHRLEPTPYLGENDG